jgi:hypothetical protein
MAAKANALWLVISHILPKEINPMMERTATARGKWLNCRSDLAALAGMVIGDWVYHSSVFDDLSMAEGLP